MAEILSLRSYSLSYQQTYNANYIKRDNILLDIEELAQKNKHIIICGDEGSGKTNTLLQLANKYIFNSFTYFVNPACRLTYSLGYLMDDLGRQFYFFINESIPPEDLVIDEPNFNNLLLKVIKKVARSKNDIYFIIDGIDQISESDLSHLISVIHDLPFKSNNFNFIISGDPRKITELLPQSIGYCEQIRVVTFSKDEVKLFFNNNLNTEQIDEILKITKGNPGRLDQVKRITEKGVSIEDFLLRTDIKGKNDLLEIEWKQVNLNLMTFDDNLIKIVSILALNDNIWSISQLSSILTLDRDTLLKEIEKISFLHIKDKNIFYLSNSYRKYAIEQLEKYKSDTKNLLIYYYTNTESEDSLINLINIYNKAEDHIKVLELLSIENLELLINNTISFAEIRKQLTYGFKASRKLGKNDEQKFKFSLYRSVLNSIQKTEIREAEIKAYVKLGKTKEAEHLVSMPILKEDRLISLIYYLKELKLNTELEIDMSYLEEVDKLLSESDREFIKENIVDIALGIACINSEKAVQIIKEYYGNNDTTNIETLIGYVSVIGKLNSTKEFDSIKAEPPSTDNYEPTFSDDLSDSIGLTLKNKSAAVLIEESKKILNISDRLFKISNWLKHNNGNEETSTIVIFGLDQILQYSLNLKPTTYQIYSIVKTIDKINKREELETIITRLDSLLLTSTTPTIGYFLINFKIIESIYYLDKDNAEERAFMLFSEIENINDYVNSLEIQANALKLVNSLVNNTKTYNGFIFTLTEVKTSIRTSFNLLISETADQYELIKETLAIISRVDLEFAIELANKLNTSIRRNKAISYCISICSITKVKKLNYELIKQFTLTLKDDQFEYNKAVFSIFSNIAKRKEELNNDAKNKMIILVPLINEVKLSELKIKLVTLALTIFLSPNLIDPIEIKFPKLISKLKLALDEQWELVYNPVIRSSLGFEISSNINCNDKELASKFLSNSIKTLANLNITDYTHVQSFNDSIRIIIRLYCAILKKERSFTYEKIENLINCVSGLDDTLSLWSEFSVSVYYSGESNLANNIVTKYIIPELDISKYTKNKSNYIYLLKICSSAIYITQPSTLKHFLKNIETIEIDNIIANSFFVLLTGRFDSEPYSFSFKEVTFSYQQAIDYIDLLESLTFDSSFYFHFKNLAAVFQSQPHLFGRELNYNLHDKLNILLKKKLPNIKLGIKHSGYLILCQSGLHFLDTNHIKDKKFITNLYKDLENQAFQIPNLADRIFTLSQLALDCPLKLLKIELMGKTFREALLISSITEKVNVYEDLLEKAKTISLDLINENYSVILTEIFKMEDSEIYPSFRRVIDVVYKSDPDLAQKIINNLDSDPGRKKLSESVGNYHEELLLEQEVLNDYTKLNKIKNRRKMIDLINRIHGDLNSNKRSFKNFDIIDTLLYTASKIPFSYSKDIFDFYIENVILNNKITINYLKSLFEASCNSADFCYSLICYINRKQASLMPNINLQGDSIIVRPGATKYAFKYMEDFITNENSKEIIIIDPYISLKDIHTIRNFYNLMSDGKITILTGPAESENFTKNDFVAKWECLTEEHIPNLKVIKVKTNKTNQSPFHDRYIYLQDKHKCLRLNSSLNNLGLYKTSEISKIENNEELNQIVSNYIKPFIVNNDKKYGDQVLEYDIFVV